MLKWEIILKITLLPIAGGEYLVLPRVPVGEKISSPDFLDSLI